MKRRIIIATMMLLVLMSGCGKSGKSRIVGKWKEIGGTDSIEFFKDGTVTITSKDGDSITGDYKFIEKNRIRMDLKGIGELLGAVIAEYRPKENIIALNNPISGKVEEYQRVGKKYTPSAKSNVNTQKDIIVKLGEPFIVWQRGQGPSDPENKSEFRLTFKNPVVDKYHPYLFSMPRVPADQGKKYFGILAKIENLGPRECSLDEKMEIKVDKGYVYRLSCGLFDSPNINNSLYTLEPGKAGWFLIWEQIPEDTNPVEISGKLGEGSYGAPGYTKFNMNLNQLGESITKTEKQINESPKKQEEGEKTGFSHRLFGSWWGKNKESSAQQKQINNVPAKISTSETSKSNDSIQNQTEVTKEPPIGETFNRDEQQLQQNSDQAQGLRKLTMERTVERARERRQPRNIGEDSGIRRPRRPVYTPAEMNTTKNENEIERIQGIIKHKTSILPEKLNPNGLINENKDCKVWYSIAQNYQGLAEVQLRWAEQLLKKGDTDSARRYINESDKNIRMFHSAKFALNSIEQGNPEQAEYYKKEICENPNINSIFPISHSLLGPFSIVASEYIYASSDISVNLFTNVPSSTTRQMIINIIAKQVGNKLIVSYDKIKRENNYVGFDENYIYKTLNELSEDQDFRQSIIKLIREETKEEITDSCVQQILWKIAP